ncbi:MAG: hypothetical protein J6X95_07470 [Treponema sp.]|nr:hypothetical protein [Treponema sp.]
MLKKRTWILIAAGAAVLLALALFIAAKINSKTIKVAFYDVDQKVQSAIQLEIDKMSLPRVRYYVLDAKAPLPKNVQKKYSMLFAKNSFGLNSRAEKFIPANENLFEVLPTSIRKATVYGQAHYALPLLLDHFEIAYYQITESKLGLARPKTYGELLRYLETLKGNVEMPLVCAGAEDSELFAFVSAMAQLLYGAEGYKKAVAVLRESSKSNKSNLPESVTRVLDEIKALQQKELLFPKWTRTSKKDVDYFMQERKIGAVAMLLSQRRGIEYNLVKYYDSDCFPRYDANVDYGIIAPQFVAVLLKNKKDSSLILGHLVSSDVQAMLSNQTCLAPVASRAEAYDRQADDVRFWAASCVAGPLNSIEQECESAEERRHALAQKIRAYLEY